MNFKFIKMRRVLNQIGQILLFYIMQIVLYFIPIKKKCNISEIKTEIPINNINIAFMGEIDDRFLKSQESLKNVSRELLYPDVVLFMQNNHKEIFLGKSDRTHFFNIAVKENQLIDFGGFKIGCSQFDLSNINKEKDLYKTVIANKKILKKAGAKFLIAYILTGNAKNKGKLKKLIGTMGFDYVIGTDKKIKSKKNYRRLDFKETRVAYSVGEIDDITTKRKRNVSIAQKAVLTLRHNKATVCQEGYLPISVRENQNDEIYVVDLLSEDQNYVEKKLRGQRDWRQMILLSEIFDIIGEKIPEKYQYLANHSVNLICSRTFELAPGNVFFFRRQFNDRNDLELQSERARTRLAMKAFTRRSLFTFSYKKLPSFIPHMVIADPTEAHIKVMAWYREKFIKARFIGITGSIGKTSTKDMLYCVLKESFNTQKNIRNTNVQVKIGMNLQSISNDCQLYVQEIGGGRPGGASRHSRMILPDAAVVTNIGTAHLGNYDSQEELMENKLGIIKGMNPNGVLYLNGDDPLLCKAKPNCKTVFFAINNHQADYYAQNLISNNSKTSFEIVHNNIIVPAEINVVGDHNVLNAVCSFAIAKQFGMEDDDILRGLKQFKTEGIRQNIISVGGYKLFLDCYNASAESVEGSIKTLQSLKIQKDKKKIAVIGDITGVGDKQTNINKKIADIIDSSEIDYLVFYGKESLNILNSLKNYANRAIAINDKSELEKWLRNNVEHGDIVLFKGSGKVKLDERVDNVWGLNISDQPLIDGGSRIRWSERGLYYNIFNDYVSLTRYNGVTDNIKISKKIFGKKITKLCAKAFYRNLAVKNIDTGLNVIHIGTRCFAKCINLEHIKINENVRFIGKEAFDGCKELKSVEILGDVIFIGKDAFRGCNKLEKIVVHNKDLAKKLKGLNCKIILNNNEREKGNEEENIGYVWRV